MFNSIFNKLRRKKNTVHNQVVLDKTETKRYLDTELNLYRYSKFNKYSDNNDPLYLFTEGFHTIPVDEEIESEEAISKSIAFKVNHEDFKKKLLHHHSLINSKTGAKGSAYKYMFEDGSLFTTFLWYRDNTRRR